MSDQLVNFAIIGFGRIGKRHAEMINVNPSAKLIAVVDIDNDCLEKAKSDYNVVVANSISEISNLNIDVLNVCTPNYLHADHCITALQNKWNVVCEKPMDLSSLKCQQVINSEIENNKKVFCVLQNRFSPPSLELKSIIDKNILGKVYSIQVNCFWNRDKSYYNKSNWKGKLEKDGGPLFTQFSHFVDLLYWLFGDLDIENAIFLNEKLGDIIEFEDTGNFHFKTKQGALGSFNYSIAVFNENFESSITIIGQKGTIKIGGQYMNQVEYCNIEGYKLPKFKETNPPNNYGQYKGSAANHSFVIEGVVNSLQSKSQKLPNSKEGKTVVKIIEDVYSKR